MALVVPGVARYTVHQSLDGQEVANVLDVHIDTITGGREDHVISVGRQIINAWDSDIRPLQDVNLTCESVSWVDLDSSSGSVGEVNTSGTITWPDTGGGVGNCMPGGVALLVKKNTVAVRNQRPGRMYIAAIPESWTIDPNPNTIETSVLATIQTALTSFMDTINSGEAGYDATLAVVHRTDVVDVGVFSDVLSLSPDSRLATQRRRQR